jgi:hypothetical protein
MKPDKVPTPESFTTPRNAGRALLPSFQESREYAEAAFLLISNQIKDIYKAFPWQ